MANYQDHPIANIFPLVGEEELQALAKDIAANGLLLPIMLFDGKIIDGRNRMRACKLAGVAPRFEKFSGDSPTAFVISMNLERRHLTASQRACVAVEALPWFEKEAKERKVASGKATGRGNKKVVEKVPPPFSDPNGKSRDQAAALAKTNGKYVDVAAKIKADDPELFKKVAGGEVTIPQARQQMARETVKAKLENSAAIEPKAATGKFDVIVVDPPWPIQKIERDERPNQTLLDYPVMTLEEIKSLAIVNDHAADDCHLFVWATQKYLPAGMEIVAAWGASYVLTFVWHKPGGFQPFGLPQYNCEFCIYGRIGAPKFFETTGFFTCFKEPRGEHSEKPPGFYQTLARVTSGRRLDVFNRRVIDGFIGWGQEAK